MGTGSRAVRCVGIAAGCLLLAAAGASRAAPGSRGEAGPHRPSRARPGAARETPAPPKPARPKPARPKPVRLEPARPGAARETPTRPVDTDPARWRRWQGREVKAITARGLARTRAWRLRHHLDTKVGARFDAARFAHDLRRIRNLELFQGIRVRLEAAGGGVAIRFRMKDKWSLLPFFNAFFNLGSVSVVAGVYDANTLGTLSYVDLKLLLFSYLPLTKDSIKPGGNLTVGIPRLFGRPFSYWLDVRAQTSIHTIIGDRGSWAGSWQRERYGGYHSLSWEAWPWLRVGVSQTLLFSRYRAAPGQSEEGASEPTVPRPADGLTHAWGLSVTLGHLTYRRYLIHGIRLSLGVSGAARWLGSDSRYVAVTGDLKAFYNLGDAVGNLGLWLHGGSLEGGRYADLFKLGSWTGLRGFYTRHFAARTYLLGTLEYRTGLAHIGFPVASIIPYFRGKVLGVQAAVFADGGRIAGAGPYRTRESGETLLSVGAGLRLVVLNLYKAVMRLDFAYVVSPYRSYDLIVATQQYF